MVRRSPMDSVVIVIIVVLAVALVAAGLLVVLRRRSSSAPLQGRFGPEYERAVAEHGGQREAEAHLRAVARRPDHLDIRPLDPAARAGYARRWDVVQANFVDHPGHAVAEADRLIVEVMRVRGYPVEAFEERADTLTADHPRVVEYYRAAHRSRQRPDAEALRRAFTHYRALFDELVHRGAGHSGTQQWPER